MIACCWATSRDRSRAIAETADTARVTGLPLISLATSSPSSRTKGRTGSVPIRRSIFSASAITAGASAGSIPARSAASVTARYIAPVSR